MKYLDKNLIKARLIPILQRSKAKKAILFGSVAIGEATRRSDLDVMIIMDTEKRFFFRHDDFYDIYEEFQGISVDLLIYTPEEIEKIRHRRFIKDILQKGEIIYEL
jgi:uncharacterized protein